jgi:hypothetical protein
VGNSTSSRQRPGAQQLQGKTRWRHGRGLTTGRLFDLFHRFGAGADWPATGAALRFSAARRTGGWLHRGLGRNRHHRDLWLGSGSQQLGPRRGGEGSSVRGSQLTTCMAVK